MTNKALLGESIQLEILFILICVCPTQGIGSKFGIKGMAGMWVGGMGQFLMSLKPLKNLLGWVGVGSD